MMSPPSHLLNEKISVQELVIRAQSGDLFAFGALYVRYYPSMLSFAARKFASSKIDSEDLVQDAFVRAQGRITQLRMPAAFGSWLKSIIVRLGLSKSIKTSPVNSDFESIPSKAESPQDICIRREICQTLRENIVHLPEIHRESIILHYYEHYTAEEIAVKLEVPVGTVKSRLFRARTLLRTAVG